MKAPSRDNIPESEGMYFESTSLLFKYVGGFYILTIFFKEVRFKQNVKNYVNVYWKLKKIMKLPQLL